MKISREVFFDGILKSLENANQLIEEGKILKEHGKFPRAYTLFQLAIEEVGKASMTYAFLLDNGNDDEVKIKKFFKNYRDHKLKTEKSIGMDYIIASTMDNQEVKKKLIENLLTQTKNLTKINEYKNYSLYTTYFENKFILPSAIISQKVTEELEFYAFIRYMAAKQFYKLGMENFDELQKGINELDTEEFIKKSAIKLSRILNS